MKQVTIKLITNFKHKGKQIEIVEEVKSVVGDYLEKKDTAKISNMLKKMFEEELCRTVVVKTRIKKDLVLATINIRPRAEDEN